MTKTEIIDLANQLTERKGERILSTGILFTHVVQRFAMSSRYWWRKKMFTFNLTPGVTTYDLSSTALIPAIDQISIEEITQLAVVLAGTSNPVAPLEPVTDDLTLIEMNASLNMSGSTASGQPGRYIMDSDYKTLRLDSPNQAYLMAITAWVMPNPSTDSVSMVVPVVPPWLHMGIVHGLEKEVWRTIYGPTNDRFLTAKAAYDEVLELASNKPDFTTKVSREMIPSGGEAIRSTS